MSRDVRRARTLRIKRWPRQMLAPPTRGRSRWLPGRRPKRQQRRLQVERLESRWLLSGAPIGWTPVADPTAVTATVGVDQQVTPWLRTASFDSPRAAPAEVYLSADVIAPGQPAGELVGTLTTTDPNPDDQFTYTLVAGPGSTDNGAFVIVGNELRTVTTIGPTAGSRYGIRVRTTDQTGLFTEESFTITVTAGAEPAVRSPSLVRDINGTGVSNSAPQSFTVVGSTLYFTAVDAKRGRELWKTDGTDAGTVLVKDIRAGAISSIPSLLTAVGTTLYFVADDGVTGKELWKTDGTEAGTVRVADVLAGPQGSRPRELTAVGSTLYFTANDGISDSTLWRTDGTEAGTVRVSRSGGAGRPLAAYDLEALGSTLYFMAAGDGAGWQVWKTDGTASGTVRVTAIRPGYQGCEPRSLTAVGTTLYFSADDGVSGRALWKTDGTAGGTALVKDIRADDYFWTFDNLTAAGSTLYFTADDGVSGLELWKTDGTAAGTGIVKDIRSGSEGAFPWYVGSTLIAIGSTLYFAADDGVSGTQLWKTDGTAAGTVIVSDIKRSYTIPTYPVKIAPLTAVDSVVYFGVDVGWSGAQLWKSDGTAAGTGFVTDIRGGRLSLARNTLIEASFIVRLASVGSTLYFAAGDESLGRDLWKTDGTAAGTVRVRGFKGGSDEGYVSTPLAVVGSTAYFGAYDGVSGSELWRTDGTERGTVRVKDVRAGWSYSYPWNRTAVGSMLYFTVGGDLSPKELWKTDGTDAGTVRVTDIRLSGLSYEVGTVAAVGMTLYFVADDGLSGAELWKTDGTAAGTVRVRDIRPGVSPSGVGNLTAVGTTLYFTADDGASGTELWKTDGTEAGTVRVRDICPGVSSSGVRNLTAVGEKLYFTADDGVSGLELWTTDGTEAATLLVRDIRVGAGSAKPGVLTAVGTTLFFVADDGVSGTKLWKTDGTAAGTIIVSDIPEVRSADDPHGSSAMIAVGTTLYFTARYQSPWNLWKTDGTAAGTVRVSDGQEVVLGRAGEFATVGTTLYFTGFEIGSGEQLWKTDGTAAGTVRVTDIRIASYGSKPRGITAVGSTLYYAIDDGYRGEELWKIQEAGQAAADVSLSAAAIAENADANTAVGVLATSGSFPGNSVTYTLVPGTGAADNGSFRIVGDELRATGRFDFETKSSYSVRVRATFEGGLFAEKSLTILVTDVLEVPGTPTGVVGTALNGQVSLSWNAPAFNGGVRIDDYTVDYSSNGGATWTRFNDGVSAATSTLVTGLVNGTAYRFRVAAVNAVGAGGRSANSPAFVPLPVPGIPRGVAGAMGNGQVTLSWTAPAVRGEWPASDYRVQYSSNGGATWTTFTDPASPATTATVTGLTNGVAYVFRVAAVNRVGQGMFSAASAPLTPRTIPGIPTALVAVTGNGRATLSWTTPGFTGGAAVSDYRVQLSGNNGATWTTFADAVSAATTATVTGLTNGVAYVFRVAALNAAGAGAFTAKSAAVTPRTVPAVPTGLTATAVAGRVNLSWTAPAANGGAAISDYRVQYSSNNGTTWTTFTDAVSSATTVSVTGLTKGLSYRFRVAAVNAAGAGGFSAGSQAIQAR